MKKIPILIAIVLLAGCSGMRSSGGSYGSTGGGYGSSGADGASSRTNYRGSGPAVPNHVDPATGILVPLG